MSKSSEIAALKVYPKSDFNGVETRRKGQRKCFIQGYEQAEKDTIERACDMLMNYVFEEVTPEMRDHFRKRLEEK